MRFVPTTAERKLMKRKQVGKACVECKRMHTACSNKRPCERCMRLGKECKDTSGRKRRRSTLKKKKSIVNLGDKEIELSLPPLKIEDFF